jgi:hypothetical protein
MSDGEINTNLGMPSLTPTPSVRSGGEHRSGQDAESHARRRPSSQPIPDEPSCGEPVSEAPEESDLVSETNEEDAHQIDRMA